MKITYTPNPQMTKVELSEEEKQTLWFKLKIEEFEEYMYDAHFHLQPNKWYDLEKAKSAVDADYWMSEDDDTPSKMDTRVDAMLEYYTSALQESHMGDCTCFPCSCLKCHAEQKLGIDTMQGVGKHMGHCIYGVFKQEHIHTCLDAIKYLQSVKEPSATTTATLNWLIQYNNDHFSEPTMNA